MAQTDVRQKRCFDWGTAGVVSLVVGLLLTTFDFLWALLKAPMVNGDLELSQTYVIGGVVIDHMQVLTQKIFYFHVPVAIVSFIFIIVAAVYAVLYLVTKEARYDLRSKTCMVIALVFICATMVSGDTWTRAEWGVWWTWDPRLTTYFILTMLTLAYFILRAAIDDPERRARLSGVFSILAAIDAPISYFITRMVPSSLHPVISYSGLEPAMLIPFICGIFGMMFVAFGLYHLALRTAEQSEELAELKQRWEDLSR